MKKEAIDISFSVVLTSIMSNLCLILGIFSLFTPLVVTSITSSIAIPFMIAAIALYSFTLLDKAITKREGLMLITLYLLFIVMVFV